MNGPRMTQEARKPPKGLSAYLAEIGAKGGKSRSKAKVEAGRRNLQKANEAKRKIFIDKPVSTV